MKDQIIIQRRKYNARLFAFMRYEKAVVRKIQLEIKEGNVAASNTN
jgi:hypothetical protein